MTKQQLIKEFRGDMSVILQEEIADRVFYQDRTCEEALRRGLQSAESRLHTVVNSAFDAGEKNGIAIGRASGIEEVKEEINHENRKLLDGFSHPKDCRMCKAHPLLQ